ncbi:hypothetical protein [Corynebacterium sanguinis]|uniref:hypothetical protein n=1 Tax=Corynebacterium sanguinis TaxID=2594913 RepID=UPI00223AC87A|nr:hypothetical protein [Corynebacterium sanguinis]MCT1414645.1 hypothetical protein [Corynebacterium sanguinis]MDN8577526.1 hypothetical protein [Corynebacterium sanguinis]
MDRIEPIPPAPKAQAEEIITLRQIEAIRVKLRLFDRQLEASAQAAASGTPQELAFKTACTKFLDDLSSIRFGLRSEEIRNQVKKSLPNSDPASAREPSVHLTAPGGQQKKNNPAKKVSGGSPRSDYAEQPAPPKRVKPSPDSDTPAGESSKKTAKFTPLDRAQLLVDREAVDARLAYEEERTVLLEKLKAIRDGDLDAGLKPEVLSQLDEVEKNYSSIWRRLESGVRGAEILASITKTKRKTGKKRGGRNQQAPPPRTRIKRNSSSNDFVRAIRALDREAREQARLAAQHREFKSMVQSHPYRPNSVAADRVYLTSGFKNPRARK